MTIPDNSDANLLRGFALKGDQPAFAEFVNRRFNLVYSVALRTLNGDHHLAKDVALQVFTDVARKARHLANHKCLEGWLFTSARFAASKVARRRIRQTRRETTAAAMSDPLDQATNACNSEIQPVLDSALESLSAVDQKAILLRFYAQLDYNALGIRLGVSANTARMRVERALQKLQAILSRRGITSTALALAATLESHALTGAPAGFSAAVTASALTAASGSSFAGGTIFAAAKWPIAATATIVATGAYLQYNLPAPPISEYSSTQVADVGLVVPTAVAASPQSELPDEREPALDPVERAYAALDNDATLLAQRLAQINAQAPRERGATGQKIYQIAELDVKPSAKTLKRPMYPKSMIGASIPGEVVLSYKVTDSGEVRDAEVLRASHPEFAANALEAVMASEFTPGEIAAQPVTCQVRQVIRFSPSSAEPNFDLWF